MINFSSKWNIRAFGHRQVRSSDEENSLPSAFQKPVLVNSGAP